MADAPHKQLSEFYRHGGSASTVYVDVSQATGDPRHMAALRHRTVLDALRDAGAPANDLETVERLLDETPGVGAPVSRFLVVRDGQAEIDQLLQGEPLVEQSAAFGPVPSVIPLLTQLPRELSYIVAEVTRDGGEIRQYRLRQAKPVSDRTIEGDQEYLPKVNAGDWSQKRYQRDAEEIWKRNEGELASAIDNMVRTTGAELLVVAGDVRARQLLAEQLAPASRDILTEVPVNTRPEGASKDALEEELQLEILSILDRDERNALERVAQGVGQDGGLAEVGIGAVVHALQQSQVDTLLVAPTALADKTLIALDREPWVTTVPEEALGATELGHVAAADALVRAAIVTDARVILIAEGELPDDQAVGALLRWPTGPIRG